MFIIIADNQAAKTIAIRGIYSTKELAVEGAKKVVDEFVDGDFSRIVYYDDGPEWDGFDFNIRVKEEINLDKEVVDWYTVN